MSGQVMVGFAIWALVVLVLLTLLQLLADWLAAIPPQTPSSASSSSRRGSSPRRISPEWSSFSLSQGWPSLGLLPRVMLVTEEDVAQIVQWGMEGAPDEVCGILLTRIDGGPRLARVANRAPDPRRNSLMYTDDILDALIEVVGPPTEYTGEIAKDLVMWHTHPGGLVGPSKDDMENRRKLGDTRCLVVTIPSGEVTEF